jgi:hypothetical protein
MMTHGDFGGQLADEIAKRRSGSPISPIRKAPDAGLKNAPEVWREAVELALASMSGQGSCDVEAADVLIIWCCLRPQMFP